MNSNKAATLTPPTGDPRPAGEDIEEDLRCGPWHRRARRKLGHSIKLRLVVLFLMLAGAMTFVFISGAQKAFALGWREAARPIIMDYVDHLVTEITDGGPTPRIERAQAIAARLPLTVDIDGPSIHWRSHPDQTAPDWMLKSRADQADPSSEDWGGSKDWDRILRRTTGDGHVVTLGINGDAFERRPRLVGYALVSLLLMTALAFWYVRHILRPLDDIQAGARRFGRGDFAQPIPVRHAHKPDELGFLAQTINTMGDDIHQMLDAKRALLLAISHELRSPLTRARLNTELLPEDGEVAQPREALLRDLQEMANLINDLLESERLTQNHAALQREAVDLPTLAEGVVCDLQARHKRAAEVNVVVDGELPDIKLDPARVRLLVRNLLDNALRYSADAPRAPEVILRSAPLAADGVPGVEIEVHDHGQGVPEDQLPRLAEAFYRPDSARTRGAGGVGLGLYLCKLVAKAHGGTCRLNNAQPGLRVVVTLKA